MNMTFLVFSFSAVLAIRAIFRISRMNPRKFTVEKLLNYGFLLMAILGVLFGFKMLDG